MISLGYWLMFAGIGLTLYVYIGYPLLLWMITRFYRKQHSQSESFNQAVTLIVSCYNEADVIQEKIDNSLAIDYPPDRFEVIFVSDGSTDGTDDLINSCQDPRIKLIRQEGRLGKTSGLNLAVPQSTGKITVFSDANAMYQPDAVKKLVRNFASPDIGYVVGAALYTDGDASAAAESENNYWKYELALKEMESDLHSVVGGDGAIYAIRKHLYQTLDARDINDFVNPLQIIAQGYRGLFDPEAQCLEETANNFKKEARRKERIVNRSFRGLMKVKQVLNPLRFGIFSWQVISHKLLRWLVPVFLLFIATGSILLSYGDETIFRWFYILETLFLWLAIIGYIKQHQAHIHPVFFYPFYFLMVNYYSLIGILRALSGDIQVTWSSPRESIEETGLSKLEVITIASLYILPIVVFISFIR
jgi:cellulose synthase/poly-beta-1,6-N-acetylglucosamine synthase-like glycosyltransferase